MFGGSDGKDAWPGIQELWRSGKVDEWLKAGIKPLPHFYEVPLRYGESLYIVERFFDLSIGRTSSGFGLTPLTWLDIDAYCRLRKIEFTNWELDLLRLLDSRFCHYANATDNKK